jgi:segregation and condensation protein B
LNTEPSFFAPPEADSSSDELDGQGLSPSEAARHLGVSRSRIYALVEQGLLDAIGGSTARDGGLRISLGSVERRQHFDAPVGHPLSPSSAWAVLALASGDAAFRDYVAARLSDPDRSRARTRLLEHELVELLPRLRGRANLHRFVIGAEALVDVLSDRHLVLAGPSAARALGWNLPDRSWPVEAYIPESALVDVVESYELEPDAAGDLLLRSVPEPWPFPAQMRVVPELVAAIDLADGLSLDMIDVGRARVVELTDGLDPSWHRRSRRRRPLRPLIPTAAAPAPRPRLQVVATRDDVWDDRAERDARALVALLFVAGGTLRRAELAEALHCSQARLDRACDFLRASPPHGLVLLEYADQVQLVTAPDVGKLVEAFLHVDPPEPLSQAAFEVLAIVVYEQPVSRADVAHIRGTDSAGVIDTLLARKLIADDARFGGRGRPAFLVTTDHFLQIMGLGSLAELPPREAVSTGHPSVCLFRVFRGLAAHLAASFRLNCVIEGNGS